MKKDLTELVFILDRSGSMDGKVQDTIGGFNSMINRQRQAEGQCYVSTILFDDKREVLHDRIELDKVPEITEKEYFTRGCTALLDAIGHSIHHIANVHKYAREEDRPESTMFVIITDGFENASVYYSISKIKQMITKQQEEYKWEFIFLGSDLSSITSARNMGIRTENAILYEDDAVGRNLNFEAVCEAVSEYRVMKSLSLMGDAGWRKKIRDHKEAQ